MTLGRARRAALIDRDQPLARGRGGRAAASPPATARWRWETFTLAASSAARRCPFASSPLSRCSRELAAAACCSAAASSALLGLQFGGQRAGLTARGFDLGLQRTDCRGGARGEQQKADGGRAQSGGQQSQGPRLRRHAPRHEAGETSELC